MWGWGVSQHQGQHTEGGCLRTRDRAQSGGVSAPGTGHRVGVSRHHGQGTEAVGVSQHQVQGTQRLGVGGGVCVSTRERCLCTRDRAQRGVCQHQGQGMGGCLGTRDRAHGGGCISTSDRVHRAVSAGAWE